MLLILKDRLAKPQQNLAEEKKKAKAKAEAAREKELAKEAEKKQAFWQGLDILIGLVVCQPAFNALLTSSPRRVRCCCKSCLSLGTTYL